ncbi:glycosyl transferase family protein [Neptunicoccus cionae]|uniref:glycosyl transferase family protein n=1 Tax=Neptunicoccus cionae TaxID=2035344 RepID=UPI000C75730A|nr:glycosyl transferase family protein [Amylibacter cionae]PLS21009.1 glycosyl transferase family protein [Amylibacter cionae]
MSLAEHVRTLGRGPGRSRSLTQDEARDAMCDMLDPDTAPEAIGALLMLLRMKGETAQEIAGLVSAAQGNLPALPQVDLDWPSYAAGRTRGAPWFLLSAKLVAQAGHKVLLHGWNGQDVKIRKGLQDAGIGTADTLDAAAQMLERDGIAYLPLEVAHPALFHLLNLRSVLGLRSCINTVCRMLNPGAAPASVQGVFHPSYRLLQADAAALLGWENLTVIKGGGGEFERHPAKDIAGFGLRAGVPWDGIYPAIRPETRRLNETQDTATKPWDPTAPTDFEADVITGTAAAALDSLGVKNSAEFARSLWDTRPFGKAA